MLPIFKKRNEGPASSGVTIKVRTPDEQPDESEEKHPADEILACAHDLIKAMQSNDAVGAADAIYHAHEIMHGRMSPEEYSGEESEEKAEPHSYDAQKEE